VRPIGLGQNTLEHQGIDVDKADLEQVERQHGGSWFFMKPSPNSSVKTKLLRRRGNFKTTTRALHPLTPPALQLPGLEVQFVFSL
jgi:hypothetical protein